MLLQATAWQSSKAFYLNNDYGAPWITRRTLRYIEDRTEADPYIVSNS